MLTIDTWCFYFTYIVSRSCQFAVYIRSGVFSSFRDKRILFRKSRISKCFGSRFNRNAGEGGVGVSSICCSVVDIDANLTRGQLNPVAILHNGLRRHAALRRSDTGSASPCLANKSEADCCIFSARGTRGGVSVGMRGIAACYVYNAQIGTNPWPRVPKLRLIDAM
jgi:hypothetical protein